MSGSLTTALLFISTLLPVVASAQAPLTALPVDPSRLTDKMTYEGVIDTATRYTDQAGEHIVILTKTGVGQNPRFKHENDGQDAELFAYHFLVKGDSTIRTWRVYDFVMDCPVDVVATFVKNAFQVTDLNADGVGEVWMLYKTACRSDVSPCDMKIIMYQGQQKFAMRGQNKIFEGTDVEGTKHYGGGNYTYDQAFADGPAVFLDFAKQLWERDIMERWDE